MAPARPETLQALAVPPAGTLPAAAPATEAPAPPRPEAQRTSPRSTQARRRSRRTGGPTLSYGGLLRRSGLLPPRECDRKRAAAADGALDGHASAVGVNERLDDGQAEARAAAAAGARLIGTIEVPEDVRQIGLLDPDAGIRDRQPHADGIVRLH